jgi:hypothetical protein
MMGFMKDHPVRIPLPPDEAVADLLRVKVTDEMPRPGKRKAKPQGRKKGRK